MKIYKERKCKKCGKKSYAVHGICKKCIIRKRYTVGRMRKNRSKKLGTMW